MFIIEYAKISTSFIAKYSSLVRFWWYSHTSASNKTNHFHWNNSLISAQHGFTLKRWPIFTICWTPLRTDYIGAQSGNFEVAEELLNSACTLISKEFVVHPGVPQMSHCSSLMFNMFIVHVLQWLVILHCFFWQMRWGCFGLD